VRHSVRAHGCAGTERSRECSPGAGIAGIVKVARAGTSVVVLGVASTRCVLGPRRGRRMARA
jgi:hypothetical protein